MPHYPVVLALHNHNLNERLVEALAQTGIAVLPVPGNPDAVLEQLADLTAGILITDPGYSVHPGLALHTLVRQTHPHIRVILTANTSDGRSQAEIMQEAEAVCQLINIESTLTYKAQYKIFTESFPACRASSTLKSYLN